MAARTRVARIIPLRPMVVPPAATACHECALVPGTQQAVVNPTVGTTHETSPTSVEPVPRSPVRLVSCAMLATGADSGRVFRMREANSVSFSSYFKSLSRARFAWAIRPSAWLGTISRIPPRYWVSSLVSVARAPASAHLRSRGYSSCTTAERGWRT